MRNIIKNLRASRSEQGRRQWAIVSWAVYDIGTTLFYVGVVGLFFPLWITTDMRGDDATVGYTLAAAMAVNLLLAPVIGALSDQLRRRLPLMVMCTLACVAMTLLLGSGGLTLSLVFFTLALVAIYAADLIYNTLLDEVSTEATRGTVAGLGVGTGYIGAVLAIIIGLILVEFRGYVYGFRFVGVIIVIVSIPLVALLNEHPRAQNALSMLGKARATWTQLKTSLVDIPRSRGLLRFLLARFWYTWSLYTASTFAVLYGTESVGLSAREVQMVLLVGIVVAIPCGYIWGIVVDRVGPGRAMRIALAIWISVLLVSLAIPLLDLSSHLWWVVGVITGIVIPGVWTADRPYLLRLASSQYIGEIFGIRGMIGNLSAMAGPFAWGFISVSLGFGQPAALLSLVICGAISYLLIAGVDDNFRGSDQQGL